MSEVEVSWLSERGDGVARVGGRSVHLHDALPGERVRVELDRRGRPSSVERVSESPERVEPGCAVFGRCGGCTVRHASESLQRRAREHALRHLSAEVDMRYIPAPQRDRWRGRARMRWGVERSGGVLGYFAAGSHRVVDVTECPVLIAPLEAVLEVLRSTLPRVAPRGELSLAMGRSAPVVMIAPEMQPDARGYEVAASLVSAGLQGVALKVPGASGWMSFGDPRPTVVGGDGLPLVLAPGGFAQANAEVNALLSGEVVSAAAAGGRDVLEFHAGAGNFTVALAREARRVTAVEADEGAVRALRENLDARGIGNVTVRHGSDDDEVPMRAEVVVLDPPRVGARALVERLVRAPPRRVVYVSCDPATLTRDLALLSATHALRSLSAFEMFPHTLHVEAVAVLERRADAVLRSRR